MAVQTNKILQILQWFNQEIVIKLGSSVKNGDLSKLSKVKICREEREFQDGNHESC